MANCYMFKATGLWQNSKSGFGFFGVNLNNQSEVVVTGAHDLDIQKGEVICCIASTHPKLLYGKVHYELDMIFPELNCSADAIAYFTSGRFGQLYKKDAVELYQKLGTHCVYKIFDNPKCLNTLTLSSGGKVSLLRVVQARDATTRVELMFPRLAGLKQREEPLALKLWEKYGPDLTALLQGNPYILAMDREFRSFTFSVAEDIAHENDVNPVGDIRLHALLSYSARKLLQSQFGGSTCFELTGGTYDTNFNMWMLGAQDLSEKRYPDWKVPMQELANKVPDFTDDAGESIVLRMVDNTWRVCDTWLDASERFVADWLHDESQCRPLYTGTMAQLNRDINRFEKLKHQEDVYFTAFNEEQRDAIVMALTNRVSVITGGPGRGKTAIIQAIMFCMQERVGHINVATAFTGKATQRIIESVDMQSYPLSNDIRTMGVWTYVERGIANKLVIIDEMSMVSQAVLGSFLNILENCHVVFVGDVNQLPSIDAGQVLHDIIDSDVVPVTKLEKNVRLSGEDKEERLNMLWNHECLLGDMYDQIIPIPNKFEWQLPGLNELAAMKQMEQDYVDFVQGTGSREQVDISDICMLVPMKKPSDTFSSRRINIDIQEMLNPKGVNTFVEYALDKNTKTYLRVGDRIIVTKNLHNLSCYNGDVGVITKCSKSNVTIKVDGGTHEIILNQEDASVLELAYAMTIHKSQGSEYKVVLLGLSENVGNGWFRNSGFMSRNLTYTGITRSKDKVLMYGCEQSLASSVATSLKPRMTMLSVYLQD